MYVSRYESFNFSSYNEDNLLCRREIYLPVDSNIELKSILKQNLPVHNLSAFFLSCFFMVHFYVRLRLQTRSSLNVLYVLLIYPYLVHVSRNEF